MITLDNPIRNQLLNALQPAEWLRLLPYLEEVDLPLGKVLYEAGIAPRFVYFPTTAIISLIQVMENGASSEIAVVGGEGLLGISAIMGGNSTPSRAVVQRTGRGVQLKADFIKQEFARGGQLMHLLLRYTQALITQMSQTAACARLHSVDQQLCRCFLLSLDRMEGNTLVMTHDLIAETLGVRRERVTAAASTLQKADLIRYRRGQITVLDRRGLELRVCECYRVVKEEYDRLLPEKALLQSRQADDTLPVVKFA